MDDDARAGTGTGGRVGGDGGPAPAAGGAPQLWDRRRARLVGWLAGTAVVLLLTALVIVVTSRP